MKKKTINPKEYKKNIMPEEKLIFSARSPVSSISLPPTTVFVAIHGNLTTNGAQGTMYICRADYKDPLPLNIDAYSFNSKLNEKETEIKGPVGHEHHWVSDIPSFMRDSVPEWVKNNVDIAKSTKISFSYNETKN